MTDDPLRAYPEHPIHPFVRPRSILGMEFLMQSKSLFLGLIGLGLAASGFAFARVSQDGVQGMKQYAERNASRVGWWTPTFESKGEIFVQSEPVAWKADYDAMVGRLKPGQRVRLGGNFWTSLDISMPATIGGAKVEPGYYYVLAEKGEGDAWSLVLLDHKVAHEKKLDAYMSETVEGGIVCATVYSKGDVEDEMSIDFGQNRETKHFSLDVAFGPHKISAEIVPSL